MGAYLFCGLESRDRCSNPLAEKSGFLTTILVGEFVCKSLQFVDVTGDAPPGSLYSSVVALAVYPEVCIIQTFNEIVSALITI